jgi:hypothetical protein
MNPMKTQRGYIYLLVLLCSMASVYGQNNPAEKRRSPEEQALFEKSVPVNPAVIPAGSQADPKTTPPVVSPTNWKPADTPMEDRKSSGAEQSGSNLNGTGQTAPAANHSQPAGTKPNGETLNYREIKGSNTQPVPPKSGNVTNYRDLNGPKTQPKGEKPKQ